MPPIRPPYPAQSSAEAVRLARESAKAMSQIAKDLGVSTESLRKQGETDLGEREGLPTAEREELTRLRREVRVLREERQTPERAEVFFAKATGRTRQRRFGMWCMKRPIVRWPRHVGY